MQTNYEIVRGEFKTTVLALLSGTSAAEPGDYPVSLNEETGEVALENPMRFIRDADFTGLLEGRELMADVGLETHYTHNETGESIKLKSPRNPLSNIRAVE